MISSLVSPDFVSELLGQDTRGAQQVGLRPLFFCELRVGIKMVSTPPVFCEHDLS
jgi:hypothetical protein